MSFSSDLKNELCAIKNVAACCKAAQLYGMLMFAPAFSKDELLIKTENAQVAKTLCVLAEAVCGAQLEIEKSKELYFARAEGAEAEKCFLRLGQSEQRLNRAISFSVIEKECCCAAFLRGAFLSAGHMSEPTRGYRLELLTVHRMIASQLEELLALHELHPKRSERGAQVVYLRSSTDIEDFLTIIGAPQRAFDIMNLKILKDIKNRENRKNNCDVANIEKTAAAAARQQEAISKLDERGLLSALPEQLRDAAEKRRENPELSLSELCRLFDPPLTRSGLNHRLKKIVAIAEDV